MSYTEYYFIPWPESQKWMEQKHAIEDGDVLIADRDNAVLVSKELFNYVNEEL